MKSLILALALPFGAFGLYGLTEVGLHIARGPVEPSQEALKVVRVLGRDDDGFWHGSAVPISCTPNEDGTYQLVVLTAEHNLSEQFWVQLFEAPNFQFQSELMPEDQFNQHEFLDLALVAVTASHPVPYLALDFRLPTLGELVFSVGYAGGEALTIDEGYVSSTYWLWEFPQWEGAYVTSAFAIEGCSGGAVLDADGELLGIIVGRDMESEHQSIFLPIVGVEAWIKKALEVL